MLQLLLERIKLANLVLQLLEQDMVVLQLLELQVTMPLVKNLERKVTIELHTVQAQELTHLVLKLMLSQNNTAQQDQRLAIEATQKAQHEVALQVYHDLSPLLNHIAVKALVEVLVIIHHQEALITGRVIVLLNKAQSVLLVSQQKAVLTLRREVATEATNHLAVALQAKVTHLHLLQVEALEVVLDHHRVLHVHLQVPLVRLQELDVGKQIIKLNT